MSLVLYKSHQHKDLKRSLNLQRATEYSAVKQYEEKLDYSNKQVNISGRSFGVKAPFSSSNVIKRSCQKYISKDMRPNVFHVLTHILLSLFY